MANSFSWKTKFKSIIIVDDELFANEYNIKLFITPYTADLKEQTLLPKNVINGLIKSQFG